MKSLISKKALEWNKFKDLDVHFIGDIAITKAHSRIPLFIIFIAVAIVVLTLFFITKPVLLEGNVSKAGHRSDVFSTMYGYVDQLHVVEGLYVEKGDLIVKLKSNLDDEFSDELPKVFYEEYIDLIDRTRKYISEIANTKREVLDKKSMAVEETINFLEAESQYLIANLKLAKSGNTNISERINFSSYESDVAIKLSEFNALLNDYIYISKSLNAETNKELLEYRIKEIEHEYSLFQQQLILAQYKQNHDNTLFAPITGLLVNNNLQLGAYVKEGDYLFSVINDLEEYIVDVEVNPESLQRIKKPQDAIIFLKYSSIFDGRLIRGKLTSRDIVATPQGTYRLRYSLDSAEFDGDMINLDGAKATVWFVTTL